MSYLMGPKKRYPFAGTVKVSKAAIIAVCSLCVLLTLDSLSRRGLHSHRHTGHGLKLSGTKSSHDPTKHVPQLYTFKMYEPASLHHSEMEWCPGLPEPDLRRVHHNLKFLFLLGAQKSGTTWLHKALFKHKLFVEANTAYLGGWRKEVRFFNNQPIGTTQDFLDCYPRKKLEAAVSGMPHVFLDSTPNYMFAPTVAPRIQQAIPDAKFIMVLRDPVARTVSSHNMEYAANGRCYGDTCHRYYPHLLEEFRNNRDFNFTTPSHMEKLKGKCNFNDKISNEKDRLTWNDCWKCEHFVYECTMLNDLEKEALGGCNYTSIPHVPTVPLTQYGLYAAQIAWWLSFFPPEQFMILTQEEIEDSDSALDIVNRILKFVGHPNQPQFTKKMIGEVKGFNGKPGYRKHMTADDVQAVREIEEYFRQPNEDLQLLMDQYFPSTNFKGLKTEFDMDDLQVMESLDEGDSTADAQLDTGAARDAKSQVGEDNSETETDSEDDEDELADMSGHATGEVVGGFLALGEASTGGTQQAEVGALETDAAATGAETGTVMTGSQEPPLVDTVDTSTIGSGEDSLGASQGEPVA